MWEACCRRDESTVKRDTRAVDGDAVERFRPPLVRRNAEAGDAGVVVGEAFDLVGEREEREEGLGSDGYG